MIEIIEILWFFPRIYFLSTYTPVSQMPFQFKRHVYHSGSLPVTLHPSSRCLARLLACLDQCREDVQWVGTSEYEQAKCVLTLKAAAERALNTLNKIGHKCLAMWWQLPDGKDSHKSFPSYTVGWLHQRGLCWNTQIIDSSCFVAGIIQNILLPVIVFAH